MARDTALARADPARYFDLLLQHPQPALTSEYRTAPHRLRYRQFCITVRHFTVADYDADPSERQNFSHKAAPESNQRQRLTA
jgi:hypothetical protein